MRYTCILIFICLTNIFAKAQFPTGTNEIRIPTNASIQIKGDLSKGNYLDDLSWAASNSVNCFDAEQNSKFNGYHVLYGSRLDVFTKIVITLIPDDKNANLSLYAYQVGENNFSVVPDLLSCIICEADYKNNDAKTERPFDYARQIEFDAANSPCNIFIGVTGANGLNSSSFVLKIKTENQQY